MNLSLIGERIIMVYQKKSSEDSNVATLEPPYTQDAPKQEEVKKPLIVKEDDGLRTVLTASLLGRMGISRYKLSCPQMPLKPISYEQRV